MPRPTLQNRLLLAFVGAPALVAALLLLCELAFVVAGVDPRQHYFVRATDEQGRALLVDSGDPPIENTHFRAERFLARPPPGTKRILCIGDSTCFGHPFDPPAPYANWLDARLKVLVPEVPVEVVNLGSSGFSCEDMLDVVTDTDCAGADVVLIYSGHNEFLDRNLAPVVRPFIHAVKRALARTRTGGWLQKRMHKRADLWTSALNDRTQVVRSTPFFTTEELARGRSHYRENLDAMVERARRSGAAVFLIHPVSDFFDTPVEASAFAAATPQAERDRFLAGTGKLRATRRTLENARRDGGEVDAGQVEAALKQVDELAAIDPTVALLHYERGRLLEVGGRRADARRELLTAVDCDAAPIRSTSLILAIQEEVAARRGARIIDPRPLFDAAAAPALPGQNGFFVDYCHPDLKGHQLLSEAILRAMAQAGLFASESNWRFGSEPTDEEYLERGGYDPAKQADSWASRGLFKLGISRFGAGDDLSVDGARKLFERALKLDDRCVSAWIGLGVVATIRKRPDEAIAKFERAAAIKPGALDQIGGPYRANPAVKALFDAAGLVFEEGRVVRAH